MRKTILLFTITASFFLTACKKDNQNITDCADHMKELFSDELKCTKANEMEVNLYLGKYKGQVVYFPMVMCPACNTIPPAFGYTCNNKKVSFKNFADVQSIQKVYDSCTKEFVSP